LPVASGSILKFIQFKKYFETMVLEIAHRANFFPAPIEIEDLGKAV